MPEFRLSELLKERPEVCYDVGVVPHLCDLKDPAVEKLLASYDNAKLINVKDDPLQVVKEISGVADTLFPAACTD